jgi:hypothetical protein
MCTELYLITTNPDTQFTDLFRPRVFGLLLLSIAVHTILYATAFNAASYIATGRLLPNVVNARLHLALVLVMISVFIGRLVHVKEVYATFPKDSTGRNAAKEYVDKHYVSWVFLS